MKILLLDLFGSKTITEIVYGYLDQVISSEFLKLDLTVSIGAFWLAASFLWITFFSPATYSPEETFKQRFKEYSKLMIKCLILIFILCPFLILLLVDFK